jgi:hypothetical protein
MTYTQTKVIKPSDIYGDYKNLTMKALKNYQITDFRPPAAGDYFLTNSFTIDLVHATNAYNFGPRFIVAPITLIDNESCWE